MTRLRHLVLDDRGVSAVEFAVVLPLLLFFLFGIIDAGRFMWDYNRAEKATEVGARYAVVTDLVAAGLDTYSFAVSDGVTQGDPVPVANFDNASCNSATSPNSCDCVGGNVCGSIVYDGTAFSNIVGHMQAMYPGIQPTNVEIDYKNVGLGYSGDPNGPDVAPLVTVKLRDLTFQPIVCVLFGCSFDMPSFRTALTLEDGSNNGITPPRANF